MSNANEDKKEKLLKLVHEAIARDKALREQYEVGEKFRFIRDRLQALVMHVEENFAEIQKQQNLPEQKIADDESLVYVYLFNMQGLTFTSWYKMLTPGVFYEYSVNRPIYADKSNVETFIRSKPNRMQHAYLTFIVKKHDILAMADVGKDAMDQPLIKVKEGALHANKLFALTYNEQDYLLNADGELIKKKVSDV